MLKLHTTLEQAFPESFRMSNVSKYISLAENDFIIHDDGTMSFKLQEGAVKEVGLNGVQPVEMLHFIATYIKVLDKEKNDPMNLATIQAINTAIAAQDLRTADRVQRGVEGTSAD